MKEENPVECEQDGQGPDGFTLSQKHILSALEVDQREREHTCVPL